MERNRNRLKSAVFAELLDSDKISQFADVVLDRLQTNESIQLFHRILFLFFGLLRRGGFARSLLLLHLRRVHLHSSGSARSSGNTKCSRGNPVEKISVSPCHHAGIDLSACILYRIHIIGVGTSRSISSCHGWHTVIKRIVQQRMYFPEGVVGTLQCIRAVFQLR